MSRQGARERGKGVFGYTLVIMLDVVSNPENLSNVTLFIVTLPSITIAVHRV